MMLSRPHFLQHPGDTRQTAPLDDAARGTHAAIVATLTRMLQSNAPSPLDDGFLHQYYRLLELITTFQQQVLCCEQHAPRCRRGCATCCMHWVEDVNSFEAIIIADYLRRKHATLIPAIVTQCRNDTLAIEALDEHVDRAMTRFAAQRAPAGAAFDHTDLLLASFYRLRRFCPLLDADGSCVAYAVRPVTCRVYVSFSDPSLCDPEYLDEHDIPTVLLDMQEEANALLDTLHARYDHFDNDTSLRTLLPRLLSQATA